MLNRSVSVAMIASGVSVLLAAIIGFAVTLIGGSAIEGSLATIAILVSALGYAISVELTQIRVALVEQRNDHDSYGRELPVVPAQGFPEDRPGGL